MKNTKSTEKKTVLITGASTGFGNLTTRRLLQEGYKVFASMRNPQGSNRARAEELVGIKPARITHFSGASHCKPSDVDHWIERVRKIGATGA